MRISDWSSDVCSSDLLGRSILRSHSWFFLSRWRLAGRWPCLPFAGRRKRLDGMPDVDSNYIFRINYDSKICATERLASRSEEHTSELQSLMRISYAVFCLKKKKIKISLFI